MSNEDRAAERAAAAMQNETTIGDWIDSAPARNQPEVELKEADVKVAHQLIQALADEWDPKKYYDTYEANLKRLIEAKLEGGEVAEVEKPAKMAPVVDLMAALKQSLAQMDGKKKPAARVAEAQKASETQVAGGTEHHRSTRRRRSA